MVCQDEPIRLEHLVAVLLRSGNPLPVWAPQLMQMSIAQLLSPRIYPILESTGVDTLELRKELKSRVFYSIQLPYGFFESAEGKRYIEYVGTRIANRLLAKSFLLLMKCLMCRGPLAERLQYLGVNEALLVTLLDKQNELVPFLDFGACLGPGLHRLSQDASGVLQIAWSRRTGERLTPLDLLRGLLEDAAIVALLENLHPDNRIAEFLAAPAPPQPPASPTLSPEVYRILEAAFAPPGPVYPLPLLFALHGSGVQLPDGIRLDGLPKLV